jgi:hypothetical protein
LDELNRRLFAAVVLLVEVVAELLTVVAAADQVPLAAGMAVVSTSIQRTVAVSLALIAGILRCTAPPSLVVTTRAALAHRGFKGDIITTSNLKYVCHVIRIWLLGELLRLALS